MAAITQYTYQNFGQGGIISKDQPSDQPSNFLSDGLNWIWGNRDLLTARPKFVRGSGSASLVTSIKSAHLYKTNSTNPVYQNIGILGANNDLFKSTSSYDTTFTAIPRGAVTSWSGNNWSFADFQQYCYCFQRGIIPKRISNTATGMNDVPVGGAPPSAHIICGAYGRLWAADTGTGTAYTLYWSDLLNGDVWNAGGAGSLDLRTVWGEHDDITAISPFDGYLIVFGKRNIVILQNPYLATFSASGTSTAGTTMSVKQVIKGLGTGCRDSVVNVGNDLIFLGRYGLHRLSRAIVQPNPALSLISGNIADVLNGIIPDSESANSELVKAVYWSRYGLYVISFPNTAQGRIFTFDINTPTDQQGNVRVMEWRFNVTSAPAAAYSIMVAPGGDVNYDYLVIGDGNGKMWTNAEITLPASPVYESEYAVSATTHWTEFAQGAECILKDALTSYEVHSADAIKVYKDYDTVSYYSATFNSLSTQNPKRTPIGFAGHLFQFTLSSEGYCDIKRFTVQFKTGRLSGGI